ncbi:MAG: hypothetical protein SYC29_16830 [Planctomycetota bacterium]|nr:hypothetical protein [Planctomycetota bacterium]
MSDDSSRPAASPGTPPRRGLRFDDSDPPRLRAAIHAAVEYRGDVTITRHSTGLTIAGFVFDCSAADDDGSALVRLLPADGGARIAVPLDDITALDFTGADAAEGKSFHAWVKKYIEKKRAGEPANIEAAPLDDD